MKKIVSAIVLAVTMTAMPALAKSGLLENSSLGETVIYCDGTGALHAAMIIKVQSDMIVDLEVTGDDGGKVIARGVGCESRAERPTKYLVAPDQVLTGQDYRRTSSGRRAVCIRRLERFRAADDDGAANGKPLVPGRALPTAEPIPRGPALLDGV
jgi:hypothetical protein